MDLFDPQTWKLPAALIDYWKTILVGAIAILSALGSVLKWGLVPLRRAWSKLPQRSHQPDRRPLRFVQDEQQSFWGPARNGQQDGTQVSGGWHVTNMSDRNVVLLRARLEGHDTIFGHVATEGLRDRLYAQMTPIPAEHMGRVVANLMYFPPIISGNGPLVADVIFTDNYEDEHRVPSRFRYIRG